MTAKKIKALTIFDAVKKFGWPEPGSEIVSREILLGEQCNAKCIFCCAKGLHGNAKWISAQTVKRRLKKWADEGAWLITLSGGEATLYPYLEEISLAAKKYGFKSVQILTNGLKLGNLDYARRLAECGIDEIKISLHGADAKTHNALMNVDNAFENAMRAVENLNIAGIKASFNFAVTAANYKQTPLFAKLAGTELGVTGFCFMFSFYSGGMLEQKNKLNISYTEVMPYLKLALQYMSLKNIVIESKMLSNFTPCLAPELINLMSDWSNNSVESFSKISTGKITRKVNKSYCERKIKLPACEQCVYKDCCYGVDKGYIEIYGDKEFAPIKKIKNKFPYKTLYP